MFTASNIDDQSAKQRNPITMYPNFRSYFIFSERREPAYADMISQPDIFTEYSANRGKHLERLSRNHLDFSSKEKISAAGGLQRRKRRCTVSHFGHRSISIIIWTAFCNLEL